MRVCRFILSFKLSRLSHADEEALKISHLETDPSGNGMCFLWLLVLGAGSASAGAQGFWKTVVGGLICQCSVVTWLLNHSVVMN